MPPASHPARRRALQPAFDMARRQVEAGTVPFVVLGVADAAGVIRVEAVSPPDGPRVAPDAVCLLASVTKPVVATWVMQLVEDGAITLEDPIGRWAPDLVNEAWAPITPWHVLGHTSGIDDIDLEGMLVAGEDRSALLRRVRANPQLTAPGTRFHYTSFPFDVLVEALARHTGGPWEDGVRRGVLEPLGMVSTTFDPATDEALAARAAPLAMSMPGGAVPEDPALVRSFARLHLAGGGLWSTADDLLRFGRAMLRGGELDGARVLSPAFVALMTREITVPGGSRVDGLGAAPDPLRANHYALGWGKSGVASVSGPAAFGHGGVSGTRLWIDPAYDLVYVYLSGCWGMPREPIDAVEAAIYAGLSALG